jgi:hypothetical protein
MRILFRSLSAVLSALLAAGPSIKAQDANRSGDRIISELHLRAASTNVSRIEAGKVSQSGLSVHVSDDNGAPVSGATVLFRLPSDGANGVFSDGSRVAVVYSGNDGLATVRNIQWGTIQGTADVRVTATVGNVHAGTLIEETLVSKHVASIETKRGEVAIAPPAVPPSAMITTRTPGSPPAARTLAPDAPLSTQAVPPSVLITNKPSSGANVGGHTKRWIVIALVGAAAAGGAFTVMGRGKSGSGSTSTITIGTPSISIGHP